MTSSPKRALVLAIALLGAGPGLAASFVYEGRLDDYGQPANGHYDLRIGAFSERHLGAPVLAPTTFYAVPVVDGQFRLEVELPLSESDDVWIEAAVREQGATDFSAIPGRSKAVSGTIGQCWSTTGDAGSNPAINFLGTTDAQPLVLRTRNAASLRLEPSAELFNTVPITANVIAGSSANFVTTGVRGATIAGGGVPPGNSDPLFSGEAPNSVTDHYGTVGGGFSNQSGDGAGSTSDSAFATVAGGRINVASGTRSTVGGGSLNAAVAADSSVSGGFLNTASGSGSSVLGGTDNTASGVFSVASGAQNCAGGAFSWAGGQLAKIRPGTSSGAVGSGCVGVAATATSGGDEGTFVWSDQSGSVFTSSGPNQFLVRAVNGLGLNTNIPTPSHLTIGKNDGSSNTLALGYQGDVTRWRIGGPAAGTGAAFEVQTGGDQVLLRAEDAGSSARVGIARDPETNTLEIEGNASKTTSGSWLANSDARIKTEIQEIDDALARLLRLRPVTFRYTADYRAAHPGIADQTYYNVIAQEFAQVFPEAVQGSGEYLPNTERSAANEIQQVDVHPALITTIAAVQELALRLEAERKLLDDQLQQLASDNATLREAAARNEARLARLEAMLAPGGH
ncbi:MAG: tail fiber domain-containing protein [Lysobacterales bacterium]